MAAIASADKSAARRGRATLVGPGALTGARRAPMPEFLPPELATLVDRPPVGRGWIYELKYDGYRVLARIDGGELSFMTRNGQDWTSRFVSLEDAVLALPAKSAILDGEIAVVKADGTTDFQALQNALREGRAAKLVYFVFDLIYLDGYDLRHAPLFERKALLAALIGRGAGDGRVRYSDRLEGDGELVHRQACRLALEGVVAKRAGSPYRAGRTRDWLKLKCAGRQEFVIGGYTDPSGSRRGLGAILVGVNDPQGGLKFCGKVGTGFSGETLLALSSRLESLTTNVSPFTNTPRMRGVHWVLPKLVAEVEFTAWTEGGNLRHPSFRGLREDRAPATVVREEPESVNGERQSSTGLWVGEALSRKAAVRGAKSVTPAAAKAAVKAAAKAAAKAAVKASGALKAAATTRRPAGGKAAAAMPDAFTDVRISNPEKVLYPDQGITKLDLARYYAQIADHILPHIVDRPLTLVRCPEGLGKPCFFQKHASQGSPPAVRTIKLRDTSGEDTYLFIESAEGLLSLVQMGALELHVWGSRIDNVEQPDRLVFDLDPAPSLPWAAVVDGAFAVRARLLSLGLQSFVKTTGGKGLHLVVPLVRGRMDWDEAKGFTKAVATSMAAENPTLYTATITKAKRVSKIFIDYLRNGRGATSVVAYSTRARPGAAVSTPLRWDELSAKLRPDKFTIETVPRRIAELREDPWKELRSLRQSVTSEMKRRVGLRSD